MKISNLCIRGASRTTKKVIEEIQKSGDLPITCVGDINAEKQNVMFCELPVYSITKAIEYYKLGNISGFILPWGYGFKYMEPMIRELLDFEVDKKDIYLYNEKVYYTFADILSKGYPDFFTLMDSKERDYCTEKYSLAKENEESFSDKSIVLCGDNWLAKYIKESGILNNYILYENMPDDTITDNRVFLICDNDYLLKRNVYSVKRKQVVFAYDFFYKFYYANASWYHQKNIQSQKNTDVIATGSSGFRHPLNIPKIYNYSNTSQDLHYDYLWLKQAIKEKTGIKKAIMGLSPFSLVYDLPVNNIKACANTLLYYPLFSDLGDLDLGEIFGAFYDYEEKRIEKVLNGFDLDECFYDYYYKGKTHILDFGNVCFDESRLGEETKSRLSEDIKGFYNSCVQSSNIGRNKEYILMYIKECLEAEIEVIILLLPLTHFYKKLFDKKIYSETMEYLYELKNKYDITVLDMQMDDLSNDCFYDGVHLNDKGAEYVREKLEAYL